jgi:hypothetical protein
MNKEIAASAILLTCVFIAIWYVLPATSQESGNVTVHFVDVGQGARARDTAKSYNSPKKPKRQESERQSTYSLKNLLT